MKTAMVISPHADDAAAFCGATLAKFADDGWKVILVRVTDDRKDSVGLSIDETIEKNTQELHKAADILRITQIIELGFETDVWRIYPSAIYGSGSSISSASTSPMLFSPSIPMGCLKTTKIM